MKGLCVRGELETEQTATYWPPVLLTIAALLFSFSWAAQLGALRAANPWSGASSHCLELQQTDSNWLNLSVDWVIYLFDVHLLLVGVTSAPNSTHPQSRLYPDIFNWMDAPVIYTGASLIWQLGRGQYVTHGDMRCQANVSKSLRRVSLVQCTQRQARCLLQLLHLYQLSSWLIYPLGKSFILVIGESPTTVRWVKIY